MPRMPAVTGGSAETPTPLLVRRRLAPARARYKYSARNPTRVVPVRPEGNSHHVEENFGYRQRKAECRSLPFRHRRDYSRDPLTLKPSPTAGASCVSAHPDSHIPARLSKIITVTVFFLLRYSTIMVISPLSNGTQANCSNPGGGDVNHGQTGGANAASPSTETPHHPGTGPGRGRGK